MVCDALTLVSPIVQVGNHLARPLIGLVASVHGIRDRLTILIKDGLTRISCPHDHTVITQTATSQGSS